MNTTISSNSGLYNPVYGGPLNPPMGNILLNAQTGQAIPLAMQRLDLSGRATPAGALLRITHSFKCEGTEPMEALYAFMLPRNGVIRRFVVKGDGFEVESTLSAREEARKEYEEGVKEGHLSVLAETNADGMVSLSVGQVRPDEQITVMVEIVSGVDVQDNKFRFRFPFTLAPNYHAQAKSSPTAGGGRIDLPQDVFGDLILPEWKADAEGLHQISFRLHVEAGGVLDAVSSPSHRVLVRPNGLCAAEIELAGNADVPNRDLVIDVLAKEISPVLFSDESLVNKTTPATKMPDKAPRWMISIPSSSIQKSQATPRRVCFVVDRSGSMQGQAMERAKAALSACISALAPTDEFGLIRFSSSPEAFDAKMAPASDVNRKQAAKFISETYAMGGTELAEALGMAVDVLGGPGGDILLLTDGEVMETGPIVEQAAAAGTRIHVLGIGAASQDRFLASLSRRTDGVQKMVGVNEDVGAAALGLFNAVRQPVQVNVEAVVSDAPDSKNVQKHTVGTVWDGKAILITDNGEGEAVLPNAVSLSWDPAMNPEIVILKNPARPSPDGLIALLWAGQKVEDLEAALDMGKKGPARKSIERELKEVSTLYGLASRVMSLCAVIKRIGDKASEVVQKQVAVGVPEGMVTNGVFGVGAALRPQSVSVNYCSTAGMGSGQTFSASMGNSGSIRPRSLFAAIKHKVSTKSALMGGGGGILRGRAFTPPGVYSEIDDGARGLDNSVEEQTYGEILTCDSLVVGDSAAEAGAVDCCSSASDSTALYDIGPVTPKPYSLRPGVGLGINPQGVTPPATMPANDLLGLLGTLEADGGVPGADPFTRFVLTALLALEALKVEVDGGVPVYRMHLNRMAAFLEGAGGMDGAPTGPMAIVLTTLLRNATRKAEGNWLDLFLSVKADPDTSSEVWVGVRDTLRTV